MVHVHTIPVPPFWGAQESWEVMCRDGRLPKYQGVPTWAVIECEGECSNIDDASHLKVVPS